MSIRVYELAKELKIDSASLITKLEEMDIHVKSHASTITEEQARSAKESILGPNPKEVVEQRVRPGVIRRRARAPRKTEEHKELTAEEIASEAKIIEREKKPVRAGVEKTETPAPGKKESASPPKEAPAVEKKPPTRAKKKDAELKPAREPVTAKQSDTPATVKPAKGKKSDVPVEEPKPTRTETRPAPARREVARMPYLKPTLLREQAELVQKVDESKTRSVVETTEAPRTEEDKKKRKRKKVGKEEVKEEAMPVKKGAKKPATRRREIITRQDFMNAQERIYKPLRKKKKGMTKKTMKKTALTTPKAQKRIIRVSETIQAGELARRMGIKAHELLKKLMDLGVMASINQYLDFEEATLVAGDYGYEVENVAVEEETLLGEEKENPEDYEHRPPVVTVMGHVDHGKTTLLDSIRKANVVDSEKGGITQHIGAYTVMQDGKEITFIDTPGHEAFTAMRARGASVTDIVILVVAADDGVMDRTREAINHAKAAEVPIIVAVNKIDKPEADPDKVKRQLSELGLVPEDWGGDTMFVHVSAKVGTGIPDLLEAILIQAEVMELKANPKINARGAILEAFVDKGRGAVSTALVQQGTLKKGDIVVAGSEWGRIRLMLDHEGKMVKEAEPAHAVALVGLSSVPEAGDFFNVVKDEKTAKQIVEHRISKKRESELSKTATRISFDELYERLQLAEATELKVIVKADVQGSVEAVADSLKQLSSDKCKLNVIHAATGPISENDVMLASASGATIFGFTVRPDAGARRAAEQEKVDIKTFDIIYELIEDARRQMEGEIEPDHVETVMGHATVRAVFAISKVGKIAGSYITDGKMVRNAKARVLRGEEEIYKGKIAGLKHFKEDVRELAQGNECGIRLENFNDLQEGDIVEAFTVEEVRVSL